MDVAREDWNPPSDFIDPVRWPALPRQGIGRGFKVAKEQIVGLMVALELFVQGENDGDRRAIVGRAERIIASLRNASIEAHLGKDDGDQLGPIEIPIETDLEPILTSLRVGQPPIYARSNDERTTLLIRLSCVRPDQDNILIDRLKEAIKRL
jgi:L-seryl-tRNA(Ser) seleniumtransferase